MEFRRRAAGQPRSLGILSGSFHPPTRAHLALAEAGLRKVDEVLFVLPRAFPHKHYEGVGLEDRMRAVELAIAGNPRLSAGISDGGLFLEIAEEARQAYGPAPELWFLCGRDAAERIVGWDYGRPGVAEEMLENFGLLVAGRMGTYQAPQHLAHRIRALEIHGDLGSISATEVRERIRRGEHWEELVPPALHHLVRDLYR